MAQGSGVTRRSIEPLYFSVHTIILKKPAAIYL